MHALFELKYVVHSYLPVLHPVEELARARCVAFGKDWCNGYISIRYEGDLIRRKNQLTELGVHMEVVEKC